MLEVEVNVAVIIKYLSNLQKNSFEFLQMK